MNWRSRQLLDHLHDAPECFICGAVGNGANIVPAHSNQQRDGKGMGIKAHDYRVAAVCHECHFEIDQGKKWGREQKRGYWEDAHRATIGWLIESERLVVSK